jgi:hypothetical protein
MVVLVLQESDGGPGVEAPAAAYDRAFEHAWYICASTLLDWGAGRGVLGVQQPPRGGARPLPEEAAEQMVVADLLNDSKGG